MLLCAVGFAFLGGCTIGNWRICGPQTPAAYCDAKALKALLNPPPYSDVWVKPGASSAEKMTDWLACGGSANGEFIPSEEMKKVWRRPEDTSSVPAYHRADDQFQRCLLGKGFVWVGRCDYSHSKSMPACGAP
jgi:hypothetical protein